MDRIKNYSITNTIYSDTPTYIHTDTKQYSHYSIYTASGEMFSIQNHSTPVWTLENILPYSTHTQQTNLYSYCIYIYISTRRHTYISIYI